MCSQWEYDEGSLTIRGSFLCNAIDKMPLQTFKGRYPLGDLGVIGFRIGRQRLILAPILAPTIVWPVKDRLLRFWAR